MVPVVLLGVVLAAGACSGGEKRGGASAKPASCSLIDQLDATAAEVAHADVSDPDAFNTTLQGAVTKYVATVKQLKGVAPASLQLDLDRLIAAVDQERFDDAADARAALDEYALTTCGRPLPAPPAAATTSTTATVTATATATVPAP